MKILQINSVPIDYPGGTEKVVLDLSRELAKKHEVSVLQTNLYVPEKKAGTEKRDGINIITCKNDYFLGGMGYSQSFKKKLREIYSYYDIIHVHGHGRFTSHFSLKFLRNKKPVVYTAHGFFHKKSLVKKVYDLFFSRTLRCANFCTALTEIERRRFLDFGVADKKIAIIPNFIDLNEFKGRKNKEGFLGRLGLDSNKKTVLYVGRVHESKGLRYIVEAIKDLDVNLVIAGRDAGFMKELKTKVEKLNLIDKVKILGEVSDNERIKCFLNSDIFVLFSEWEGFGIVVIEAMAAGLPVIVSDRGALPEVVEDGVNGLVARFPDIVDLKKKIGKLINDDELYKKIKLNEMRFVERFDIGKVVARIEELYEKEIEK